MTTITDPNEWYFIAFLIALLIAIIVHERAKERQDVSLFNNETNEERTIEYEEDEQ